MPSFLVEGYLASPTRDRLAALVRRAQALEAGAAIRYIGSLALLDDEVCFHIFEAPSATALVEASERGDLTYERVVETVWVPGLSAGDGGADLERT